jgi:L-rhamnose-H+ transport protein
MSGWKWENTWLVYSISGLLVIPWIAAFATVSNLGAVLTGASEASIWRVLLFGLGWGVGSVLFGLGIARMGLAVGYGLFLGLIAPIGTFLPLIVLHPEQLQTRRGTSLIAGTLIVVCGIILCAIAGKMRERSGTRLQQGFAIGLLICVLAGILSPMLNFSFAFGGELQQRAVDEPDHIEYARLDRRRVEWHSSKRDPLCRRGHGHPDPGDHGDRARRQGVEE